MWKFMFHQVNTGPFWLNSIFVCNGDFNCVMWFCLNVNSLYPRQRNFSMCFFPDDYSFCWQWVNPLDFSADNHKLIPSLQHPICCAQHSPHSLTLILQLFEFVIKATEPQLLHSCFPPSPKATRWFCLFFFKSVCYWSWKVRKYKKVEI